MVCGTSSDEERRTVQQRLRTREINFIFVADLYNEGVDIPEVDTVLFLRPTESLTIYLQQLGRGLRLCRDKEVLTVLDFIGSHRREFRFDRRLRALLNVPVRRVDDEVERGFPHLPVGCSMQLERVARDRVLENIRSNLTLRKQRIIEELRECKQLLGRPPTIGEALDALDGELDELLSRGLWSDLLAQADHRKVEASPDAPRLARGIRRLAHVDDPVQIEAWLEHLRGSRAVDELTPRRLAML